MAEIPARHLHRAWFLIAVVSLGMALATVFSLQATAAGPPPRQACPSPTATPGGQTPTATSCPSPTATSPIECEDGIDNDGDGKIDHPADPGCTNKNDDTEVDSTPTATVTTTASPTTTVTVTPTTTVTATPPTPGPAQCDDGIDNDGDTKIDHPADPECESKNDTSEAATITVTPVPSAITIRHRLQPRHRFKGLVTASEAACVAGRRVVVKKVIVGPDARVARTTVAADGRWRARHRIGRAGRYYAVVRPRLVGNFQCLKAKSGVIRVRR